MRCLFARAAGQSEYAKHVGDLLRTFNSDGSEGARLIALNMALNGTPREATARYLRENFHLLDPNTILEEVYARSGPD